jgi:hypothetical protein
MQAEVCRRVPVIGYEEADPSVRFVCRIWPCRLYVSATCDPGAIDLMASISWYALLTGWLPALMMMSPGFSPALAAGPPGRTVRWPVMTWAPFPVKLSLIVAPMTE